MRRQGIVSDWKDDKGFGFIAPDGGGAQVFVHARSFSDRRYRPRGGDRVSYELLRDDKGRPRAGAVAFVGQVRGRRPQAASHAVGPAVLALVAAFFCVLGLLAWSGRMPWILLLAHGLVSTATYLAYKADKSAAIEDRWRTPEAQLHLMALAGGWPGALLAQRVLRHKSSKPSFQMVFWITVVLHGALLGWLLFAPSAWSLRHSLFGMR
ncbi:MAG: cold shock and DUF1294 domain-containing protein [Burkholderiaceae bacterium]|jgi:uncharacterized membrane protein YsdA (DUF1294 family)/cold shock CspA family protein|nr:cold shock and DUF1294 domain-containing protein [Burkholderiaceae bacterium]